MAKAKGIATICKEAKQKCMTEKRRVICYEWNDKWEYSAYIPRELTDAVRVICFNHHGGESIVSVGTLRDLMPTRML